eukprot:TRINITY_DN2795_c0_g4_i1.p1 TRINITY_DN2795_c0_g4~~TRINITY_DN2795_c0_g4_i1.p1  ORF type:complete len:150 (-),score=25.76 TRINITY_DN2795_c0_g4_i1:18-467(-)
MYKSLTVGVVIFGVLSIITYGGECYLTAKGYQDLLWNVWWIFTFYWEYVYLSLTLLIAIIWRPSENNTRFKSSKGTPIRVLSSHDGPSVVTSSISLVGGGAVSQVYSRKPEPLSPVHLVTKDANTTTTTTTTTTTEEGNKQDDMQDLFL